MYSLLPPVLFPGESPLSRDVRLCLLLAFLVHLAAIPFLARAPYGPLTMPVVFFLGVTVLWAVPGLLVFQTVVYAINALVLLVGAWAIRGAREGEDLLFLAGAVPFLAAALPMGYARYRQGGARKMREGTRSAARPAPLASATWALGAALLAILAAGLGILAYRNGEAERTDRTGREDRELSPAFPLGSRLNDHPDSIWREIEAGLTASAKRREEAMRRLASMSPEEMFVNDSEAPASFLGQFNLSGGRRYFGNRTYSWEAGYEGKDRYLPFSCRRGMLRGLVPRWVHSLLRSGEKSRFIAKGRMDNSLFRTFQCREFSDSSSVYFAQVDEISRTASWKAIRPGYGIWISRRVGGKETVWPRLRVEFHPDPANVNPPQAQAPADPEGIGDLFMVSDVPPAGDPFPYARLTFSRELPVLRKDSVGPGSADPYSPHDTAISFDLAGFDSALVQRVWIEARISTLETEDFRREVTLAVLKCRTREGEELILAESKRTPDEDPILGLRINEVVVTDINGDGDPDFLVQGNYLPERLILTRKNAIEADIRLFPGRGR